MSSVISLRPEMGDSILAHLGKMAKLPKFGVVAGQAVASAIEDLWGAGGGVYNDLDVFIPSSGRYTGKDSKASKMPTRCEAQASVRSGYGGSIQRHLEMVQTYRIEEVRYAGLINRIYFRLPDAHLTRAADHAQRVIGGFDINAVRVGIDLRTRKLVWDAHYEQFLANRELRIAACYTPAHSLVRLLKKAQELPDVTVDIETGARITAMLQSEGLYQQLNSAHLVSYLFGDKFAKLAEAHKSQWLAYYELEDEWFHQATATGGWRRGSGDETSVGAKMLRRMTPRGELDAQDQEFARALGAASVVALPSQVYRQRDKRRNGFVQVLAMPEVPEDYLGSHLPHYADVRGADYLEAVPEDDLDRLRQFTHSPWARHTMGWSGKEQLNLSEDLETLETLLAVPDAQEVLSWAASEAVPFSIARLEVEANKRLESQRKPVHRSAVALPDMATCPVPGASTLSIAELDSDRALQEYKVTKNVSLYEPEGHWGHRYFVLEQPDDRHAYTVLKVALDAVDTMTSNVKLVHSLNRHTAEGAAAQVLFTRTAAWLKAWWAERGHLFKGLDDLEPELPF